MSTSQVKRNIGLPSFPEGADKILPDNHSFFPYNLRQKVYIITSNIAIGLAGLGSQITKFLEDIRMEFKYKESTLENFERFINEYDFSVLSESSCVIIFINKEDDNNVFYLKKIGYWREQASKAFEYASACGTGSKYFLEAPVSNEYISGGTNKGDLQTAIALNYYALCNLMSEEKLTLHTLKDAWGAGFELIYSENGCFKKLDDLTYIVWKAKLNLETKEYNSEPMLIFNYKYVDDILLITATDGKQIQGYVVPPLDKRREDIDDSKFPKKPYFKANIVCSAYVLEASNGKIYNGGLFTNSDQYPPLISVDIDTEGYLEIRIDSKIEHEMMENFSKLIDNKLK